MPIYTYFCKSCGLEYDQFNHISNRRDPEQELCKRCSDKAIRLKVNSKCVGDPFVYSKQKLGETNTVCRYHRKLKAIDKTYGTKTYNKAKSFG